MENLLSTGPHGASEALRAGLVDGLEYRDQVYEQLRKLGHFKTFCTFFTVLCCNEKAGNS
jgi:hypothetical protein